MLIHPAALNMAASTLGYDRPRRCRCWYVLAIVAVLFAGFMALQRPHLPCHFGLNFVDLSTIYKA